jgi:hypothetical protein
VLTVWAGYLLERTKFRSQHNVPASGGGQLTPSFEEEVSARSDAVQIYTELKEKDGSFHDPYWETVSEIKRAGFIPAYVWIYLRQPDWRAKDAPHDLAAFGRWSQVNLRNHQALTIGRLVIDQ